MPKSNAEQRAAPRRGPRQRKPLPPDEIVNFTIRVHAEARRQLRIRSAVSDVSIEEIVRGLLYPALGLKELPVVLDPASTWHTGKAPPNDRKHSKSFVENT